MYIPKYYEVTDLAEIESFVRNHPFGTIISNDNGRPLATHVPMEMSRDGDGHVITGHLAKGNPQWKTIDDNADILLIFQGPHAYVSSSWYETEEVSTWNYQSVHIYGSGTLLSEDELENDLIHLLDRYEGHRDRGRTWDNLSEKSKAQMKSIVGFRIKVDEVQAAYKMNQNKNGKDYDSVVEHLSGKNDQNANQIAEEMKRHKK
jgi:transcriptional regulator